MSTSPCTAVTAAARSANGREAAGHRLGYANCLFADFDYKRGYGSVEGVLAHLDDLWNDGVPYPTATVATGGGVHAYWVLERAVDLRKTAHRGGSSSCNGCG